MSDLNNSDDLEEEDENTIALDDLESIEHDKEHQDDPYYNESDWGESYDDLDSEAWERQYRKEENEEIEKDPWELG